MSDDIYSMESRDLWEKPNVTPRPDRGSDGVLAALDVAQGYLRANAVPETDYPSDPSHALRATVALLERLRELIGQQSRLVRCEACNGSGGGQVSETEAVGCEYCHATGKVIVLPSSLLTGPPRSA